MTDPNLSNPLDNVRPVYSIFDRVAGFYCPLFIAENDDHAKRMMMQSIDLNHKEDYELVFLGTFNSDKGDLYSDPNPKIILKGKNIQEGPKK
ncbi:nonstructural protein [Microviridae sp.]|nr:nonstructural protein [Microviridae sp.]